MPDTPPKILIIVRAGRESLHHMFASGCAPYADIAVSTFEDVDWSGPGVKFTHYARGGKYQGISDFFAQQPQVVDAYDYFWFFEDDLEMTPETLAAVHGLLTRFRFMLAAPALTPDSHFSWTIAVRHAGLLFRGTDFVEQMAPIMSRAFLRAALPHFAESYTGFGYEWLWQRLLQERGGYAAILDSTPIRHGRPLGSGMLYKNRPDGSNNEQEMRDFLTKFGLDAKPGFSNRFALTAEPVPRLLTGDALTAEMTESFQRHYPQEIGKADWCVSELMNRYRPSLTLEELSRLDGFALVDAAVWRAADVPVAVRPRTGNLAFGKPVTRSTNTGTSGSELDPWWQVDLLEDVLVEKVVVVSRSETPLNFSLSSSLDGETWHLRGVKLDHGATSAPYTFAFGQRFPARFVRLQLIGIGDLHLDEIAIYEDAEPVVNQPAPEVTAPAKEMAVAAPVANTVLYHTAVVVCARWETEFIVEWLTYYQCIGYEHVYLYCNDDDPAELYEAVLPFVTGRSPFVTFVYFQGQGLQYAMYMHFIETYSAQVRWVSFFDVDEFLRITDGTTIDKFLTRYDDDVDCILFNWSVFGTSGHKTNPPGKVLENYTKCAGDVNLFTKFIGRAALLRDGKLQITDYAFGFWHGLHGKLFAPVKVVNVLGSTEHKSNYEGEEAEQIRRTAIIHHYLLRSEEAAQKRVTRGLKGDFFGQGHWDARVLTQYNDVEDLSLANFWKDRIAHARDNAAPLAARRNLLSRGKPCTQSSMSEWSTGATIAEDAGNAVNGKINGSQKFHTQKEMNPWWQIDLEAHCAVTRIVVYNAANHTADRLRNFKILASGNASEWHAIHVKEDGLPVGSWLTRPFILDFAEPVLFRHMRIMMLGEDFLHLDQVEIYGEALPG